MTRFEQELSGALGAFWKKNAEEEIAKMQRRVDNDEIRTNIGGGAFWNILSHTDFPFSIEETARAREAQTAAFLDSYRKSYKGPTAEERMEMEAAFGKGTTVVNVITGKKTRL